MNTWKKMITEIAKSKGEEFESLLLEIDAGEIDREFDDGYGGTEGAPFTAWGKDWVYFPICYDGAEWVGCAPRGPMSGFKMQHQGG